MGSEALDPDPSLHIIQMRGWWPTASTTTPAGATTGLAELTDCSLQTSQSTWWICILLLHCFKPVCHKHHDVSPRSFLIIHAKETMRKSWQLHHSHARLNHSESLMAEPGAGSLRCCSEHRGLTSHQSGQRFVTGSQFHFSRCHPHPHHPHPSSS